MPWWTRRRVLARQCGLRALASQEVTVHKLTQRLVNQFGFTTTGMLLGWTPAWGERLRLLPAERTPSPSDGTEARVSLHRNHRRTETVSIRPFLKLCEPYAVALPRRFEPTLRTLYDALGLPVRFIPPVAPWGRSRVVTDLDLRRSLAVVELTQVGTDAADVLLDRLVHFRDGMVDLIHFVLPLSGPSVEEVTDILVESGCRYAALLPFYRGYDVLMLQYTNMLEIDLSESDFHSPMARALYQAVISPVGAWPGSATPEVVDRLARAMGLGGDS